MEEKENNHTGVLTQEDIRFYSLITQENNDIPDSSFSNASFDFRLDDEYYIPGKLDGENKIKKCSDALGFLTIPPFTSVIIGTYENVKLPTFVSGRFDLRISWALAGLILQVGTQIEPGYEGKLFGVLHNLSNSVIKVRYKDFKDTLLTAEFHYTSKTTEPRPTQKDKLYKIQDFISKGVIHGTLYGFVEETNQRNKELKALTEKLEKNVEKELERVNEGLKGIRDAEARILIVRENATNRHIALFGSAIVIAALVISICVPTIVAKMYYDRDDTPKKASILIDSLYVKEKRLDIKINKVDSLKNDFNKLIVDQKKKFLSDKDSRQKNKSNGN